MHFKCHSRPKYILQNKGNGPLRDVFGVTHAEKRLGRRGKVKTSHVGKHTIIWCV